MEDIDEFDFTKQWELGYPVFEKLFNLKSDELRAILIEICGVEYKEVINGGDVFKSFKNDMPRDLEIRYYSKLSISPFGITYYPEHGNQKDVVKFNKFFKLDI